MPPVRRGVARCRLQAWVHRLAFQREDAEDAFVDATQRLLAGEAFEGFDRVLGVVSLRRAEDEQPPVPVDEIERLIEARHAARRSRDFGEADRIRDGLMDRGVLLEDSPAGTRWKKK